MVHVLRFVCVFTVRRAKIDRQIHTLFVSLFYPKLNQPGEKMTSENVLPTVMVTVYGKPKQKKTSDALAAFPTALFLGVPSAITLVAQNELGFTPTVHPQSPKNLTELVFLLISLF